MDEVKAGKKGPMPAIYIVGLVAALLVLVFSCGLIALALFFGAPPDGGTAGNGTPDYGSQNASSGNGSIALNTSSSNISAEDMSTWNSITIANVQQACLMRAKEEAGPSADMVYSCTCEESATAIQKRYDCAIRTADPFTDYFANIGCSLSARACSVETNYGTTNVSFGELRSYYSD